MAAGLAAQIRKHTGLEVKLVQGKPGQFDVFVDGENIATRAKGWQRLFGGGWPQAEEVIAVLRARQGGSAPAP